MKFPWRFIILSYGIAWLFWIPVAISRKDYQSSPLLLLVILVGVFGPGIAGIIRTYAENGIQGGREFWRRMVDIRRIRPIWYVIIILLWPILHALAILLSNLMGGEAPEYEFEKETAAQPLMILVVIVLYFVQAGLEELGWRGYLLERMHKSIGPTRSSLIIGVFHAFWHLPLFWVVGTNQIEMGFGIDFVLYIAFVIASSIFTTWCYIGNGSSTLAATLLHCTGNLSFDIFATAPESMKHRIYIVLMVLGALMVILKWRNSQDETENHNESLRASGA